MLIDSEDDYKALADAFNRNDWNKYIPIVKKYFPRNIQKHFNKKFIIFNCGNDGKKDVKLKIPVVYKMECKNDTPIAACNYYRGESFLIPTSIDIFPKIMVYPDRVIDCIIAHELAHGVRFLSGRARDIRSAEEDYRLYLL